MGGGGNHRVTAVRSNTSTHINATGKWQRTPVLTERRYGTDTCFNWNRIRDRECFVGRIELRIIWRAISFVVSPVHRSLLSLSRCEPVPDTTNQPFQQSRIFYIFFFGGAGGGGGGGGGGL